jgi:hypothetical protein
VYKTKIAFTGSNEVRSARPRLLEQDSTMS